MGAAAARAMLCVTFLTSHELPLCTSMPILVVAIGVLLLPDKHRNRIVVGAELASERRCGGGLSGLAFLIYATHISIYMQR